MLQIKHGQSREIVTVIFTQTTQKYNFKQNQDFRILSVNTVYCGSESTSYLSLKIWEVLPVKINEFSYLYSLEKRNQKLGTTKLSLQASQAMYKWYWFSSMMFSYIFYVQSICFIILLQDFNALYVFVLIL